MFKDHFLAVSLTASGINCYLFQLDNWFSAYGYQWIITRSLKLSAHHWLLNLLNALLQQRKLFHLQRTIDKRNYVINLAIFHLMKTWLIAFKASFIRFHFSLIRNHDGNWDISSADQTHIYIGRSGYASLARLIYADFNWLSRVKNAFASRVGAGRAQNEFYLCWLVEEVLRNLCASDEWVHSKALWNFCALESLCKEVFAIYSSSLWLAVALAHFFLIALNWIYAKQMYCEIHS